MKGQGKMFLLTPFNATAPQKFAGLEPDDRFGIEHKDQKIILGIIFFFGPAGWVRYKATLPDKSQTYGAGPKLCFSVTNQPTK